MGKATQKFLIKNLIILSTTRETCNCYEYSLVQNDCVWLG